MESHDLTNDFPIDDSWWDELELPSSILTYLPSDVLLLSDQEPKTNYSHWTENDDFPAESSMKYTNLSLGFVVPELPSSKSPTSPQLSTHNAQSLPSTAQQGSKSKISKSTQSTKSQKKPIVYRQSGKPLFGQNCFQVNFEADSFQLRSRSSDTELRRIRKLKEDGGACLRCRLLKKQCYGGRPCARCIKAEISHRSPTFQWMNCVLSSPLAESPFKSDSDTWQGLSQNQSLFSDMLNADVKVELGNGLEWNLLSIANIMSQWMNKELKGMHFSIVGLLSSRQLVGLVQEVLSPELCDTFKVLIFTTSRVKSELLDFFDQDLPSFRTMLQLAGFCGQDLLKCLDKYALTDRTKLAKQPRERLIGLFIILGGLVVATRYYVDMLKNISSLQNQSHNTIRRFKPAVAPLPDIYRPGIGLVEVE